MRAKKIWSLSFLFLIGTSLAVYAITTKSHRAPASLQLVNQIDVVHEIPCKTDALSMEVKGEFVRLKGTTCAASQKIQSLSVRNETNGFTATVFAKSASQFETDLIELSQGENWLEIASGQASNPNRRIRIISKQTL